MEIKNNFSSKDFFRENLSQMSTQILDILQKNSHNQLEITKKLVFDILSLEKNIVKIENENIFLKGKKKNGKKLNIQKFLQNNF